MILSEYGNICEIPAPQNFPVMSGNGIFRITGCRIHGGEIQSRSDAAVEHHFMELFYDTCLGQHHMMVLLIQFLCRGQLPAFWKADGAGMQDHGILFVDRQPVFYGIPKVLKQNISVFNKSIDCLPVQPPALFFEAVREIEMVHGHDRLDIVFQALCNHIPVKIKPFFVYFPGPFREDSCPCDRETVGFETKLSKQGDIFPVSVVVIAGNRKISDTFRMLVHINDRRALAILVYRAFNLIGGSRCAPEKSFREWFQFLVQHDFASFTYVKV